MSQANSESIDPRPGIVLLAAGLSKRFGGAKLLAKLVSGRTVLAETITQLLATSYQLQVVYSQTLENEIEQFKDNKQMSFVLNVNAEYGLSETIRLGLQAAPCWPGWLFALADMPLIQSRTYSQLLSALEQGNKNTIVAPLFQGKRGNPVAFGRYYQAELLALSGDVGAKPLLKKYQNNLQLLELGDPGVLQDIDLKADVATVNELLNPNQANKLN